MEKGKTKRKNKLLVIYFLGILTGFGFFYLKTLCSFEKQVVYKDDSSDLVIRTEDNLRFRGVEISSGTKPLMKFEIDKVERTIVKAGLYDESQHLVGRFYVTNDKFSDIEMLTDETEPFFQMSYDNQMQRWCQATYCMKTQKDIILGDFNEDINVDGQFDITKAFDNQGNYIGSMIFFNNSWYPAVSLSENDLNAEIATDIENKETLGLTFDFAEGWIPATELKATSNSGEN